MLILILKYGWNLGASGGSAPWTPVRGLAYGPHPSGAWWQTTKTLNLAENLYILSFCSQTAKNIAMPWAASYQGGI